ncbi:hypothetical protein FRB99_006704 [Tulasnella sp. 403]|nr:hypothetical protein FRB99_006704 [Tulasnella sp. 403]
MAAVLKASESVKEDVDINVKLALKVVEPCYLDLIRECIVNNPELKDGVSRPVIKDYLKVAHGIDIDAHVAKEIGKAIKTGRDKGILDCPNGLGGRVKLLFPKALNRPVQAKEGRPPLVPKENVIGNALGAVVKKAANEKPIAKPVPNKVATRDKENARLAVNQLRANLKNSPLRRVDLNAPRPAPAAKGVQKGDAVKKQPAIAKQHVAHKKSPVKIATKPPAVGGRPYAPRECTVSRYSRKVWKGPTPIALRDGLVIGMPDNPWQLVRRLGAGGCGDVWLAVGVGQNASTGAVALKAERLDSGVASLVIEEMVYRAMDGVPGFAKKHCYLTHSGYSILGMGLLGRSFYQLLKDYQHRMPLNLILRFAINTLRRLEALHARGFVHRDIKPENVLVGVDGTADELYLVDFGFAKRYKAPKSGEHIPPRNGKGCLGTPRYASLNVHDGREPSRRDDLESLAYSIIYLCKGNLPWQSVESGESAWTEVGRVKASVPIEYLCLWIAPEFGRFLSYCRALRFDEKPDYQRWRVVFREVWRRYYPTTA